MYLVEVIEIGKPFKRPNHKKHLTYYKNGKGFENGIEVRTIDGEIVELSQQDFFATDWEFLDMDNSNDEETNDN